VVTFESVLKRIEVEHNLSSQRGQKSVKFSS